MGRICFSLLLAAWAVGAKGQTQIAQTLQIQQTKSVTIEDCYSWARQNYPLVEQLGLIERTEAYNLANAAKGWLPQVTVSAQASWQSDVTSLPFNPAQLGLAGATIPTLSRDQYGAKVEVAQTVWDGGAVGAQREGVRAAAEEAWAGAEVTLYALRERVNGLFFGILLSEEQLERLALLVNDLETNIGRMEALVRGGLAGQTDVDAIRIERLKAAQQQAAIEAMRRAYVEMLARLTGRVLDTETQYIKPSIPGFGGVEVRRPELALFDAQVRNIEARERRLNAAVMPKVGLYATGGYGKPGLNMLANRFDSYYVVGARVSWSIGGLYTRREDRRQIVADKRGVEARRETFLLDNEMDIVMNNSNMVRLQEQLRYDDEIIALRISVLRASEAKIASGTLSGSDLARDINALEAARQDKIVHEMEFLQAFYGLKLITNN